MKYFANGGGMYSGNTIPNSMMPNTNTASYEQVDQQRIAASQNALQTIEANPWQQQFAQQQQQRQMQNQALNQSATQGMGMINDRLASGKSFFGKNAQELATSQGFEDTLVDGVVTETAGAKAGAQAGNIGTAGMVADFAGQGISSLSDDDDATTLNAGETTGTVLSGAGKGASIGATIGSVVPGVGTAIGAGVGATIGAGVNAVKGLTGRNKARELEAEEQRKKDLAAQAQFSGTLQGKEYSGSNMGQLKQGGYRNFYMGGGPLNYAGEGLNNKSPNMYKGGGFDFNVNQERQRVKDYNAPGGTADQYETIHNTPWSEQLDNIQTGLTVGGMSPGVGIFADAGNTLISGARTLTNALSGNFANAKKHALNTGVNLMTMAPAFGQVVAGTKLSAQALKQANNLRNAENATDLFKAVGVNTTGVINNAFKGNPQYMSKMLGKTTNLENKFDFVPETDARTITGPSQDPRFNQIDTGGGLRGDNNINPALQQLAFNQQNNSARTGGLYNTYGHGGTKGNSTQLDGGVAKPIPGSDAVEFIGKKHEQGGIKLDPYTEVEDKETMDKVEGNDYFFSSYLKLGGKSFAARHKQILAAGGQQKDIDELASIQEKAAGRDKYNLGGERRMYATGGQYIKFEGGDTVYYKDDQGNIVAFNDESAYMNHRKAKGLSENFTGLLEYTTEARTANFNAAKQKTLELKGKGKDYEGKLQPKYQQNFQTPEISDSQMYQNDYSLYGVDDKFNKKLNSLSSTTDPGPDGKLNTDDDIQGTDVNQGLELWGENWLGGIDPEILQNAGITSIDQLLGKGNEANVKKLQQAWNASQTDTDKIIKDDGLFGEQTRSIYQQPTVSLPKVGIDEREIENKETGEIITDKKFTGLEEETKPDIIRLAEDQADIDVENAKNNLNKSKGKGINWLDAATGLVGLSQLAPAYMAFKQKPDYMNAPGRMPTTHLDRVRFNAEREQNEGNYRGMGRLIETSGAGPAGIAAKMAAWGKKQTQDTAIGSQEARQNAAIQAQEAQLNSANAQANIKNAMYVDEYNRAEDTATKNRKVAAVQNATQSMAGMIGDIRNYKATDKLATATAGTSGVLDRFEKQELFKKRTGNNPFSNSGQYTPEYMSWESETYGNVNTNTPEQTRHGGKRKKSYFKKGGKLKKMC